MTEPIEGMDRLLTENTESYGRAVLADLFPNAVDGLKMGDRRILWAAREFPDTGMQGTGAIGAVKRYHDHGDDSIYQTIARLSQPHRYTPPLMTFTDGVKGDYVNDKPAAYRYTRVALSAFAREIYFQDIDVNALPMTQGMDLQILEPQHLAPAIPMGLILGRQTIGFGYSSRTPARNLGDICTLTAAYCEHLAKGRLPHLFDLKPHAKRLLPDFPVQNTILNHRDVLQAIREDDWTFTIEVEGQAELGRDRIRFLTLPVTRKFDVQDQVRKAIDAGRKSRNPALKWIEANVVDAVLEPDCVTVQLRRNGTTPFQALERLSSLLRFRDRVHPIPNYVNEDGHIARLDPLNVLALWYERRHGLVLSSKRRQLRRLYETLRILEALLVISDHTSTVVKMIRENTREAATSGLMKRFSLTRFQAEHLVKAPLHSLSQTSKADLRERHHLQKTRIKEMQLSLTRIPEEMAEKALEIRKRHGRPRISSCPVWKGYVQVQDGWIQFEDPSEIATIQEAFPNTDIQVHTYASRRQVTLDARKRVQEVLTKVSLTEILDVDERETWTSFIRNGKGAAAEGILPGSKRDGFRYTGKEVTAVFRSGIVKRGEISQFLPVMKTLNTGRATKVAAILPRADGVRYLLVSSAEETNVLTLHRITPETGKILLPALGDLYMDDTKDPKDWYVSLPRDHLSRISTSTFHLRDLEAILGGDKKVRIEANKAEWKTHPQFSHV